ncbi:MAG: hypothetical protein IJ764_00345 [Bacteroidales bacterium]|nr:hypothetical protein [Bacteroidales bacterium]
MREVGDRCHAVRNTVYDSVPVVVMVCSSVVGGSGGTGAVVLVCAVCHCGDAVVVRSTFVVSD